MKLYRGADCRTKRTKRKAGKNCDKSTELAPSTLIREKEKKPFRTSSVSSQGEHRKTFQNKLSIQLGNRLAPFITVLSPFYQWAHLTSMIYLIAHPAHSQIIHSFKHLNLLTQIAKTLCQVLDTLVIFMQCEVGGQMS